MRKRTSGLLTHASTEDSNQPTHARNLIGVFIARMKKACILGNPKYAQGRFWSDCANAQSDQNLPWANMFEGTFPDSAAHFVYKNWHTGFLDTLSSVYVSAVHLLVTGHRHVWKTNHCTSLWQVNLLLTYRISQIYVVRHVGNATNYCV